MPLTRLQENKLIKKETVMRRRMAHLLRIETLKLPFITAVEEEDTEEDIDKFGVRIIYCIYIDIYCSVIGFGLITSLKTLKKKSSRVLRC